MQLKTCSILGVNINIITMQQTKEYICDNIEALRGKYICVSNVHTTVMSHDDEVYKNVQNSAALRLPDGKPLSVVAAARGFKEARRVTGPDLMGELFAEASANKLRHFFYGSTEETLKQLEVKLKEKYPDIVIAGMYSPPFGALSADEDARHVEMINSSKPDIVWIGLGAPKQERWMHYHMDRVNALMIGVGAGFDYYADNIKRAPLWMQKCSLEWLYRLIQDPKRLAKRYMTTNMRFIKLVNKENKKIKSGKI